MVVQVVHTPSATYEVSGNGYVPEGEFRKSADSPATQPKADPELYGLLLACTVCNDAVKSEPQIWTIVGDHRRCLLSLAGKARLDKSQIEQHLPVWASFLL